MTHPYKHLGSQTSQMKRQGEETCCTHIQMLSLALMSRTMLMFITDILPKADVNFYCGVSHSGQNIREDWTSQRCRGARPPFANKSAACLQITCWEGSGSDFSKTLDLIFSPPLPESTLTCQTSSSLPSLFLREKKKSTKPDNCTKIQEAVPLILL